VRVYELSVAALLILVAGAASLLLFGPRRPKRLAPGGIKPQLEVALALPPERRRPSGSRRTFVSWARLPATVLAVLLVAAVGSNEGDLSGGQVRSAAMRSIQSAATPRSTPARTPRVTPSAVPSPAVTPTPSAIATPEPTPEPPPPPTPEPPTPAPEPAVIEPPSGPPCGGPPYLTWIWRFSTDGSLQQILSTVAASRGGVIIKTHDGTDWMAKYDPSPDAVTGPAQVASIAQSLEGSGVPFHAWAVVKGIDPIAEAQMASDVLAAGARSLFLDLEPWPGFWAGSRESARVFGEELRRLQPIATIVTAVDPRPWTLGEVPLSEFASFSNALAPLIYWDSFDTPENRQRYALAGWPPLAGEMTPEFLLDVSAQILQPYGLPIQPVGQGTSGSALWARFLDYATLTGAPELSVWRYGVVGQDVWSLLGERTPSGQSYVVQPGDTLSLIGRRWGVDAQRIAVANRLADPNLIYVGQDLCIPLG